MTDTKKASRLPLYLLIIGGLLLGAVGGYIYMNRPQNSATAESVSDAGEQAESAMTKAGMNGDDRAATEAIVRAYILENPEIISDAIGILQEREMSSRVGVAGPALTEAFAGNSAGNPAGDVTVVEFSDYNCGYCRAAVANVQKLLGADKNVRLVYREVPILAQSSRDAALWALAAAKQGKHDDFHQAMFNVGQPNAANIQTAAQNIGLDIAAAKSFAASDEAAAELDNNLAMMEKIGFGGTPTFIVGGEILQGAQDYPALQAAVEKARKKG